MKEHLVERPDQTSIIGCIETYEVDPASAVAAPERRCYTVEDLIDILRVSRPSIYNLINEKVFRCVKVGGKYRISKKSFDAWLDAQE